MATMVIGGLWHGAGWTFVAWGAYHGALLCIHRYLQPAEPRPRGMLVSAAKRLAMFHLVCLGWLLFRAESLSHVVSLFGALSNLQFGLAAQWLLPFAALVGPLLIVEAIERYSSGGEFPLAWPLAVRVACYAMIIAAITIEGAGGSRPFIYFQF
jgi:D-alanyl-lipoteichoic acid acyltransferase DltB (MBOAT superfamily)